MAKPPPYPPKSSGRTMAGPKKKGLKHPSFAGSDTKPYNVRPQKPKATSTGKMMAVARGKKVDPMDYVRPKPKSPAAIGENLPKPYKRPKKKPTSGSTSARIRNMEKMYSKRRGIREL